MPLIMNDEQYIATDDREVERVDAPCNHPRCPAGECRAYSAETLKVTDADRVRAQELVNEGWSSLSNKHRCIIRWKPPGPPTRKQLAEAIGQLDTDVAHINRILDAWDRVRLSYDAMSYCPVTSNEHLVERATLSISLHRAFKQAYANKLARPR